MEHGDIRIRQAGPGDLGELMAWRMEVLHEVFAVPADDPMEDLAEQNRRYYERALESGGHIACFVSCGGETVGCGGLCLYREMPSPDNPTGLCGYLMNIYTRAPWRRRGIGGKTAAWLVRKAQERGAGKIYLEASDAGMALYRELGFRDMDGYLKYGNGRAD